LDVVQALNSIKLSLEFGPVFFFFGFGCVFFIKKEYLSQYSFLKNKTVKRKIFWISFVTCLFNTIKGIFFWTVSDNFTLFHIHAEDGELTCTNS
jgi:hypothetical protein